MERRNLPSGVKIARIVNVIQATIFIALFGLFSLLAVASLASGETPEKMSLPFVVGMVFVSAIVSVFSIWLIINLGKLNPVARKVQIVLSVIFLVLALLSLQKGILVILIHGFILYSMFTKETKEAFGLAEGGVTMAADKEQKSIGSIIGRIIYIIVGLFFGLIILLLLAIAIPNFIKGCQQGQQVTQGQ